MVSEPVTFLWAEIEGFRGFRDRQRISLEASVVILTGPNGTGKTSFFDALQWLLIGTLERLEPWRTRRNTEHIANAFRGEEPASVTAAMRIGDRIVEVCRQGRHDRGFLEWVDADAVLRGEAAEQMLVQALAPRVVGEMNLRCLLLNSALLQQDVVREVLEDKPADRYVHLASLLGLNDVREFELAVRKRADRFAASGRSARDELTALELQHRRAVERVENLRARQAAAPDTARAREEMQERLAQHRETLAVAAPLPADVAAALLLQNTVADLGNQFAQFMGDATDIQARAASLAAPDAETTESAKAAAAQASAALQDAQKLLDQAEAEFAEAARQSEALASLAQAALPLLGDRCPVCQQEIEVANVAVHLQELIAQGGAALPALDEKRAQARAAALKAEAQARESSAHERQLAERERQGQQISAERERLIASVRAGVERARSIGVELLTAEDLEQLDSSALQRTIDALRTFWAVAGDLAGVLRALPAGEELAAADGDLRRIEKARDAAREKTTTASASEEEARTLQRATTRAAAAVAESRFSLLAPLVGDIFSRLDPHPVFKTLDFSLGVYYEKGVAAPIVRDTELGLEADPLLVFSSSQANVAALSYFLALGWAAGADSMPFVLLDDPLQSLDDVNALGFADLCRHIRQQRQLIVSTHDRRLASLLERKLAPRSRIERTRVIEFSSWTRRGPQLEQRVVEPQIEEGNERRLVAAQTA